MIVIVIGLALWLAFDVHRTRAFLKRARRHVGCVVGVRDTGMEDPSYSATVQFERAEGPQEVDVGPFFHWPPQVGDRVEILYDSLTNAGRLDTLWHIWRNSIVIFPFFFFMVTVAFHSVQGRRSDADFINAREGVTAPTPPVYRVGGDVTAPQLVRKVDPEYSEEARKAKKEGTVVLKLVVQRDGIVRDIKVIQSVGLGLDERAIGAVKQWRFNPALKGGRPVDVAAMIEVTFRLTNSSVAASDFWDVAFIVFITILVVSWVSGRRCPICKRYFALQRTGAWRDAEGDAWDVRWSCKHCGKKQWRTESKPTGADFS